MPPPCPSFLRPWGPFLFLYAAGDGICLKCGPQLFGSKLNQLRVLLSLLSFVILFEKKGGILVVQCENPAYGSFLIIPLKYDTDTFDRAALERIGRPVPMSTMDVNENVKAMLEPSGPAAVGSGYLISAQVLTAPLSLSGGDGGQTFQVSLHDRSDFFFLRDSWIYVFHTRVAFLCLSLAFSHMEALKAICNPGWAHNPAVFSWLDSQGCPHPFSLEQWLEDLLRPLGLRKFFDGDSSYLLDSYAYNFTLVPRWFDDLEPIRRITFNLHKMMPPDAPMEDQAEEDIRYVYAAKNQDHNAYRWGCCVTSQTISYVVADEGLDLEGQRAVQAADGLPVVLLALYEKYTCLRFTQLITALKKIQIKELKTLKNLMLNFQAFGTVTPANLSRWHNVKQIYANLLEVNDIPAAVQDISTKLSILASHQEALEHARSETVINLITLFGIVSILASVLSIVQILSDGNTLIWVSTILTTVMLALVTALAILRR